MYSALVGLTCCYSEIELDVRTGSCLRRGPAVREARLGHNEVTRTTQPETV